MDMNKTNSSIDENEESLVGEVLSDDEVREKRQAIAKWQHSPVGFSLGNQLADLQGDVGVVTGKRIRIRSHVEYFFISFFSEMGNKGVFQRKSGVI